ncbi:MAG: mannosyltransferase, partial [Solirubrobacteraceae bacterium]|nr:mannosyltransferase [Solirubrobacteraceae bacterium]
MDLAPRGTTALRGIVETSAPLARRRCMFADRAAVALAAVVVLAAVLRFATLDTQSFWTDEAVTIDLLRRPLGELLPAVRDSESTPPLYYLVAWVWAQVFDTGEFGIRALSALAGTVTVPVVAALGGRLAGRRGALIAAGLAATNPLLVWYSQEARAYALLVLLVAASLLVWLTVVGDPSPRRLLAWGALCALALATHYFAIFTVAAEAAGLLLVLGRRRLLPLLAALAVPAVTALVLLPLALEQQSADRAAFIRSTSLVSRIAQIPKQLLVGYDAPAERLLSVAAGLLVLAALAWLVLRRPWPRPLAWLLAVVTASLLIPVILAPAGADYLLTRNVIGAAAGALTIVAAGFARARPAGLGAAAAAALTAIGLVAVIGVDRNQAFQRDDWRGAVRALRAGERPRAVVVVPAG